MRENHIKRKIYTDEANIWTSYVSEWNDWLLFLGFVWFDYQHCSDFLWEKFVLVIMKNFWNSRLKVENLKIFRTIYSNSERSELFLVTECLFNLFLEVSHLNYYFDCDVCACFCLSVCLPCCLSFCKTELLSF